MVTTAIPGTLIEADSILYAPSVVQQQREGVCLLIDPAAPNWVSTNGLGSQVVRRCDGRHTLGEIVESLSHELELKAWDLVHFIHQAVGAGILSTGPDLAPAYRGRAEAIGPEKLEELWITTNLSCPLRCKHCLVNAGVKPPRPMTTAEIEKLVDDAVALGVKRIYFTGGEPLLRRDLFALVEYVTARAQLVVLTSGVLVSEEKVAKLKALDNGNLLVQVSLEGPDAETNDAIRGSGNFDRAVRGIKRLVDAGLPPIVTTTITKLNHQRVTDTTRFVASLGVQDHHVLWLHGRGRMRQNVDDLSLPGARVSEVMGELRQTAKQAGIIVDNAESLRVRVESGRGRKNDLCNACFGMLSVNADGHVYPCAALSGAPGFDCGSIKEKSLKEIWQESPVASWIRQDSVQKRVGCNSCFLKYFCGGGCFAQSYFAYEMTQGYGCIMAPDPYCEAYKTQLLDLMWEAAMPGPEDRDDSRPMLYHAMDPDPPSCAVDGNKVLDAAFNVGTYHCACVLAMDVNGGS
ncbi:MAG: radical SAM protein [Dehalococcoidia bacterium]|nr:radical SAM protein [Dehalococcoidia bacterium]